MTSTVAQPTKADMAAIASILQRMIAAWSVADAEAIANLFVDDGTLIIAGAYCAGRPAIKEYFIEAFQNEYRDTQVTGRPVASRFFGADVGVLVSMGGVLQPGETEVSSRQAVRSSWTVVRRDGEWRLAAYQNTPRERFF